MCTETLSCMSEHKQLLKSISKSVCAQKCTPLFFSSFSVLILKPNCVARKEPLYHRFLNHACDPSDPGIGTRLCFNRTSLFDDINSIHSTGLLEPGINLAYTVNWKVFKHLFVDMNLWLARHHRCLEYARLWSQPWLQPHCNQAVPKAGWIHSLLIL